MSSKRYRSTFRFKGKRYARYSTVSQREADLKADQLHKDLEAGNIGISNNMRVSAWAYEWLETYKRPRITEKNYRQHFRYVDSVIVSQIGGLRLCDVTDMHLQRVMNSREGYSYSDVKFLHYIIKSIFSKARKSRLIVYDPSEDLSLPHYTKGKRRSITPLEREHFLKVTETHSAGLMFRTMLYCGVRPGELCALSWKDIDFDAHMINVVASLESGNDSIMKAPKSKAGIRKIPIPDVIYYDLLKRRGDPFDPVFAQETTGRRHTETSRKKAWRSIINAMDDSMGAVWEKRPAKDGKMRTTKVLSVIAPDLVMYCLRHTYCTDMQIKGVPLKVASYLMGHSTISVTANIYTHVTDVTILDAAILLGVSFEDSPAVHVAGMQEQKSGIIA